MQPGHGGREQNLPARGRALLSEAQRLSGHGRYGQEYKAVWGAGIKGRKGELRGRRVGGKSWEGSGPCGRVGR